MDALQVLDKELGVDDVFKLADAFYQSGYFRDVTDAAKAVVKIKYGQELGIGAVSAMQGLYFTQGKIELDAGLIAALIKRGSHYNYVVRQLDSRACSIEFFERAPSGEWASAGVSTFTIEDAKQADLLRSANYTKYPRNMLFSRAITNGARWFCPDVFGGSIYYTGEISRESVGLSSPDPSADDNAPRDDQPRDEPLDNGEWATGTHEPITNPLPAGLRIPSLEKPAETAPSAAAPAATPPTAGDLRGRAKAKLAVLKTPNFAQFRHWAVEHKICVDDKGFVNEWHLRGRIKKLGFDELSDENWSKVQEALLAYKGDEETE